MGNYGFRINKYFIVSIVIGILDLIIFYIIGNIINDKSLFHIIIDKWQYLSLFIISMTIFVYFIDILLFSNRKRKFKFLLFSDEPFKNWKKMIYKDYHIEKIDEKKDFYKDIYLKVRDNNNKIKEIMKDEILIRDIDIHILISNTIIVLMFLFLQNVKPILYLHFICFNLLSYIMINVAYKQYVKYYINEIYIEYKNIKL